MNKLLKYLILTLTNSGAVYAVYTPYVLFWLRLTFAQYVRWLEGGVLFSLATGWLFAMISIRLGKKLERL